ncbi:MAG TPA: UDP-N-acetylmuramoyl-L-alanine--D-glutamate ligase, partial [Clostridia bacterium]|nr:UDP-N-acetylmuramoyl-L-alanine--D-glutamate ligase [Clostridia bacterium]
MEVRDQRILVIGMGKSGVAAAKVLSSLGGEVTLADIKPREELEYAWQQLEGWPVRMNAGGYPPVREYDLLVTSPGVPVWSEPLQEAVSQNIPVYSEMEIASRLCGDPIVAVTGTNGKTTTTALIGQMFTDAGIPVAVSGNIGIPLIQEVIQGAGRIFVVEVSSFQLEWVEAFHPKVAIITNLTPDHLERHGSMENYLSVKARIFARQTLKDYTVLNYDDPALKELGSTSPGQVIFFSRQHKLEKGISVIGGKICIAGAGDLEEVCRAEEVSLPGAHNLENALAAVAAGWSMGLTGKAMANSLRSFPGVPHRLERVAMIQGVQYINDSKGTNPEASIKAIEAFSAPLILIAGGSSKGSDFHLFAQKIKERVKELILVGETAQEILQAVTGVGYTSTHLVQNLEEAVFLAHQLAGAGDLVML